MFDETTLSRAECIEAIRDGDLDALRSRLPVHARTPHAMQAFLEYAAEYGRIQVFEILEEFGVKAVTDDVVIHSAKHGQLDAVKWLVDHGAPVNELQDGIPASYAVQVAANAGHADIVKLLIDHGALIDAQTQQHLLSRCSAEVCHVLSARPWKTRLQARRDAGLLGSLPATRLPGELEHLAELVDNLADNALRRKYAEWLSAQGDGRGEFLTQFADACESMAPSDFPDAAQFPLVNVQWLEAIGNNLIPSIAEHDLADQKELILQHVRPAIELVQTSATDADLPVGASKFGGLPDLPPGVDWPVIRDCSCYRGASPDADGPCKFIGQINLADLAGLLAARELPSAGLLSIFAVLDWSDETASGVRILWHQDLRDLQRAQAPAELAESEGSDEVYALSFQDLLMLPDQYGLWKEDLKLPAGSNYVYLHSLHTDHILGYAHPANTDDPTPGKEWRHLLTFTEPMGKVYVQIRQQDLQEHNLEMATLVMAEYVDP